MRRVTFVVVKIFKGNHDNGAQVLHIVPFEYLILINLWICFTDYKYSHAALIPSKLLHPSPQSILLFPENPSGKTLIIFMFFLI